MALNGLYVLMCR